jgi:hypothetical protein
MVYQLFKILNKHKCFQKSQIADIPDEKNQNRQLKTNANKSQLNILISQSFIILTKNPVLNFESNCCKKYFPYLNN